MKKAFIIALILQALAIIFCIIVILVTDRKENEVIIERNEYHSINAEPLLEDLKKADEGKNVDWLGSSTINHSLDVLEEINKYNSTIREYGYRIELSIAVIKMLMAGSLICIFTLAMLIPKTQPDASGQRR
jgi:hypothetical protein